MIFGTGVKSIVTNPGWVRLKALISADCREKFAFGGMNIGGLEHHRKLRLGLLKGTLTRRLSEI